MTGAATLTANRVHQGGELPFSPRSLIDPSPALRGSFPAKDHPLDRYLGSDDASSSYLVDKDGNEYEPYSLAWRYLGMYVDCDMEDTDDQEEENEQERRLEGENDGNCERVLLWAAYHDPGYKGGSIGEYQFFDLETKEWDKSLCETRRCAKMDCHEPNTHFDLVGVFKETDGLVDWSEQLFKHQGYCLWDSDTYEEMQDSVEQWPTECTELSYYTDSDGNQLYLHLKPEEGANINMGLYIDDKCSVESSLQFYDYVSAYYTNVYGDEEKGESAIQYWNTTITSWNSQMDMYKVCQPCRAYSKEKTIDSDEEDQQEERSRFLEGDNDGEGDAEQFGYNCYDDAGYTNCNQCYKFETQTDMEVAEAEDLARASSQGSILEIRMEGVTFGKGGFRSHFKLPFSLPFSPIVWLIGLSTVFAALVVLVLQKILCKSSSEEERDMNANFLEDCSSSESSEYSTDCSGSTMSTSIRQNHVSNSRSFDQGSLSADTFDTGLSAMTEPSNPGLTSGLWGLFSLGSVDTSPSDIYDSYSSWDSGQTSSEATSLTSGFASHLDINTMRSWVKLRKNFLKGSLTDPDQHQMEIGGSFSRESHTDESSVVQASSSWLSRQSLPESAIEESTGQREAKVFGSASHMGEVHVSTPGFDPAQDASAMASMTCDELDALEKTSRSAIERTSTGASIPSTREFPPTNTGIAEESSDTTSSTNECIPIGEELPVLAATDMSTPEDVVEECGIERLLTGTSTQGREESPDVGDGTPSFDDKQDDIDGELDDTTKETHTLEGTTEFSDSVALDTPSTGIEKDDDVIEELVPSEDGGDASAQDEHHERPAGHVSSAVERTVSEDSGAGIDERFERLQSTLLARPTLSYESLSIGPSDSRTDTE